MRIVAALMFVGWLSLAGCASERNTVGLALAGGIIGSLVAADYNDRAAHCIAGAGSSYVAGKLLGEPWMGWTFSIGLGALKEHSDTKDGEWDNDDLAVTALCGAVPYAAMEFMRE